MLFPQISPYEDLQHECEARRKRGRPRKLSLSSEACIAGSNGNLLGSNSEARIEETPKQPQQAEQQDQMAAPQHAAFVQHYNRIQQMQMMQQCMMQSDDEPGPGDATAAGTRAAADSGALSSPPDAGADVGADSGADAGADAGANPSPPDAATAAASYYDGIQRPNVRRTSWVLPADEDVLVPWGQRSVLPPLSERTRATACKRR